MLSAFEAVLADYGLSVADDRVLVAVSGGVDSMTLLALFRRAGYKIGAAHANFGLRGAASDLDAAFVRDFCVSHRIAFYSAPLDAKAYAREQGVSLQMAARALRYRWFFEIMEQAGYRYVATAHHADDNLETCLLNLVRGSGLEGLVGIPPTHGRIVRPLLTFSRKRLIGYARAQGIPWREDATNRTTAYRRNRMRMEVLPLLKRMNPSLEKTFLNTQQRLAGAAELAAMGLQQLKKKWITPLPDGFRIDKAISGQVHRVDAALWALVKSYGFTYDQCVRLAEGLHGQTGKRFLSATHQLIVDRQHVLMAPLPVVWEPVEVVQESSSCALGPWRLTLSFSAATQPLRDSGSATLDASKLRFPLQWRQWRSGDAFYPLGMHHRKKVSDFFIDKRLSLLAKQQATVITSEGRIVWVVGHRIDRRFAITDGAVRALHLSVK